MNNFILKLLLQFTLILTLVCENENFSNLCNLYQRTKNIDIFEKLNCCDNGKLNILCQHVN